MSVKKLSGQKNLFETGLYLGDLVSREKGAERFAFFRKKVWPDLARLEPKLSAMYCEGNGRPAVNPVRLLGVSILQFMEKMPDRQAAEAVVFDVRWKTALGMEVHEGGFDSTVLVRFRERLLEHGMEGLGFDAVLEILREAGYLRKNAPRRLDSTHVLGQVAAMSRLECVREAIRLALEALEREEGIARPGEWPLWWERHVESKPDYKAKAESLRLKMDQAGRDARELLAWVERLPEEIGKTEPLVLLKRVFEENFEVVEGGEVSQRRSQPPRAVHNPHDPEAHWSSKDTIKKKEWVGYKAQVVETVEEEPREKGEPTKSVITAVVTQDATASDKAAIPVVEKALEAAGEAKPTVLYTDGGYSSGAELARAEEEGRELRAPVQPAPEKDGRYSAEEFDVSVANRTAKCPAGQEGTNCSRLEDGKTGKVTYRFEWKDSVCQACDKKSECLGKEPGHRRLLVGEHHDHVQERRVEQKTEEFAKDMRHRNAIEGTISELARGYGMRKCRYRGKPRARLQNLLIGAACNVKRWCRRVTWELRAALKGGIETGAVPARA